MKFSYSNKPPVARIEVQRFHKGQCHCGAVKFTVHLEEGLVDPCRCNCSICKRHGAIMGFVEREDFTIDEGGEALTLYQFNTNIAKHYFCSRCGIYTHHQRRSIPTQVAFNIGCLDGVDPHVLANVRVIDGESRHPSDMAGHALNND